VEDIEGPARELASALEVALPEWVERCVEQRYRAAVGEPPASVVDAARAAGEAARADVAPRVRALLEADIDQQWTTPLSLLRSAVRYPTRVLADAAVPPVPRAAFEEERFPDDVYDLTPATFSDIGERVGGTAIVWGAAKAWAHRHRHGGLT